MRLSTLLSGFILSLFVFSAHAGTGHDHGHSHGHSHGPVSEDKAKANAAEVVTKLIKRSKIDKSWGTIQASSVEKITVQGMPEWKVVFENENIKDESKQKLYVFLTMGGDYIAANFTGK